MYEQIIYIGNNQATDDIFFKFARSKFPESFLIKIFQNGDDALKVLKEDINKCSILISCVNTQGAADSGFKIAEKACRFNNDQKVVFQSTKDFQQLFTEKTFLGKKVLDLKKSELSSLDLDNLKKLFNETQFSFYSTNQSIKVVSFLSSILST